MNFRDTNLPSISRRNALLGMAAAGIGLTFITGTTVLLREKNEQELLRNIIKRNMPSIKISDEDIVRLRDDIYKLEYNLPNDVRRKKFKLVSALAVFAEPKSFFELVGLSNQLEVLERTVITYFILGSDFLDHEKLDGAKISYNGYEPTCGNPFMRTPV